MKIIGSSFYQRENDKIWIGAVELETEPGKPRKKKTVSSKDKKIAKQKLNKLIYEIENGDYITPSKDTLIGFLKEYHKICANHDVWNLESIRPDDAKWEETTSALYKMYIDVHFEPYFKDMKLTDVRPIILDKFYNYKMTNTREVELNTKKGIRKKIYPPLSNNTIIKLNKFLKPAFNYAQINGLIKNNPTVGIQLGSKEEYKPTIYNEEKFFKLLNFVEDTDDEVYIVLGGGCGYRRGEICGLDWKDIDFEKKTITIKKTTVRFDKTIEKDPKNETSSRTTKVADYVLEVLLKHKRARGVTNLNQKVIIRWKPQSMSERFKLLLDKFGMEHIRLHDLRHYNAVIMMKYGVPDKVAAEMLGHANVTTLRKTYQHVLDDMETVAASGIDQMFKKRK